MSSVKEDLIFLKTYPDINLDANIEICQYADKIIHGHKRCTENFENLNLDEEILNGSLNKEPIEGIMKKMPLKDIDENLLCPSCAFMIGAGNDAMNSASVEFRGVRHYLTETKTYLALETETYSDLLSARDECRREADSLKYLLKTYGEDNYYANAYGKLITELQEKAEYCSTQLKSDETKEKLTAESVNLQLEKVRKLNSCFSSDVMKTMGEKFVEEAEKELLSKRTLILISSEYIYDTHYVLDEPSPFEETVNEIYGSLMNSLVTIPKIVLTTFRECFETEAPDFFEIDKEMPSDIFETCQRLFMDGTFSSIEEIYETAMNL